MTWLLSVLWIVGLINSFNMLDNMDGLSGGVAANSRLRAQMTEKAGSKGVQVFCPAPKFCTDNGAMIALAGYHCLQRCRHDGYDLNADADLTL